MRTHEQFQLLVAELEQDWVFIQECFRKNQEMAGRIQSFPESDEFAYAALGYTLHNLYNAFEGYFLRVAKFFENGIGESGWHKNLLERMTLTIEGVRPAVISRELLVPLEELLKFRLVFRNIYKSALVPKKIMIAQEAANGILDEFINEHQRFVSFLMKGSKQLEKQQ